MIIPRRLHLCCGSIYLAGYINCDINGKSTDDLDVRDNLTTLDNYFKDPWEPDVTKRKRKEFIIDHKMNILEKWCFEDNSIDEMVMVSAFEHFEHLTEIPHIVSEAFRVLKKGGIWKFDVPHIKEQVEKYYYDNPEFLMELIYCNHKNDHSKHCWGYTPKTINNYLKNDNWDIVCRNVVEHDYPMQGFWATKK